MNSLKCRYVYKNKLDFDIHLEVCNCKYICAVCKKVFSIYVPYFKHINTCQTSRFYRSKCKICGKIYIKRGPAYFKHIKICEELRKQKSCVNMLNTTPVRCRKCLNVFENRKKLYLHYMKAHQVGRGVLQNNFNLGDVRQHLNIIYNSQKQSFKLNMMFRMILKSVEEKDGNRYRAWLCYKNEYLFNRNLYVSKRLLNKH